ncbi:MAG TPA: ATP-binding cassette domain-containing protein [Jatrophihabitans sp.]|jgi:ABC-type lipoprotein export system ATPase subunit|uniref:ATP-binding cassette domain-containing protein n=1 Tax=Jatrophihabitans sp. TaxID=1932789 RepID=UPI002F166937
MSARVLQTGLAIYCEHLSHYYELDGYEVTALDNVEFSVAAGESVALLGPSGSGKSTLLSLLAGLLRPTSGQIYLGADDITVMSEPELLRLRGQRIGVVVQNPSRNLLPYGTAEQNISFAQRALRGYRRVDLLSPAELLAGLGLAELSGQRVSRMSGGEQQRLSVAVAMAGSPGLLLADEPTSQLDTANRDKVGDLLTRITGSFGTTVVVVTHDPAVAAALGRSVTITEGRADDRDQQREQFVHVEADGAVRLPPDVLASLPPGSRLRVVRKHGGVEFVVTTEPERPGGHR